MRDYYRLNGYEIRTVKDINVILFGLLTFILCCSQIEDSRVVWREGFQLSYSDFKGVNTDEENPLSATSYCRINDYYILTDSFVKYNITAEFNRKLSWIKFKDSSLLKHEQLHFDIYELYARKIRAIFSSEFVKDYSYEVLNDTISQLINQSDFAQLQYDKETGHGTLSIKQKKWENKIQDSMRMLNAFSATDSIIIMEKRIE